MAGTTYIKLWKRIKAITPSLLSPTILVTAISNVFDYTLISRSENKIKTEITIRRAFTKLKIRFTIKIPISNV
jgi:hypothetical protein